MTKQFTEEIAKIKSALKLKKDFNLVNKYSGKKQGCYTIFVLPNGEKYWALSGTDSWDRNKRLQMEMLVNTYLITRLDGIMLPIFIQKIMASDTVLLGRKLCVIQR